MGKKSEFLIITGMSGAGKTQAINYYEDRGFFCVDNLPASLLGEFIDLETKSNGKIRNLAFVIDVRDYNILNNFFNQTKLLKDNNINFKIIFLDASDEELVNRYNFTRRKHPLDIHTSLLDNINEERKKLEEIKKMANFILDTTGKNPKELVKELDRTIDISVKSKINISIIAFGFKYGAPRDLDLLFDLRFLPNPFYIVEFRDKTGDDKEIQEYVMSYENSKFFYKQLVKMLDFLLPLYIKEGKSHLLIGLGCTGGKHRSVTFANKLYDYYSGNSNYNIKMSSRDKLK